MPFPLVTRIGSRRLRLGVGQLVAPIVETAPRSPALDFWGPMVGGYSIIEEIYMMIQYYSMLLKLSLVQSRFPAPVAGVSLAHRF